MSTLMPKSFLYHRAHCTSNIQLQQQPFNNNNFNTGNIYKGKVGSDSHQHVEILSFKRNDTMKSQEAAQTVRDIKNTVMPSLKYLLTVYRI